MEDHDLGNLLRVLRLTGGKFVIVEDGKPKAVLMDYEEFENLILPAASQKIMDKLSEIESVNEEITKAQAEDLRSEVIVPELETEHSSNPDNEETDDELSLEPLDQI